MTVPGSHRPMGSPRTDSEKCSICCASGGWCSRKKVFTLCQRALGREPRDFADYARDAAMQSINVAALRWPFMAAFFGTAASCALLAVGWLFWRQEHLDSFLFIGGVIYLVGSLLVTALFNVPRNEKLADVRSDSAEAAELWSRYVAEWTAWNHLRAVASLLAAALLTIAI